MTMVVVDDSSL